MNRQHLFIAKYLLARNDPSRNVIFVNRPLANEKIDEKKNNLVVTKLLKTDPIWIRIHNTAMNYQVASGSGQFETPIKLSDLDPSSQISWSRIRIILILIRISAIAYTFISCLLANVILLYIKCICVQYNIKASPFSLSMFLSYDINGIKVTFKSRDIYRGLVANS